LRGGAVQAPLSALWESPLIRGETGAALQDLLDNGFLEVPIQYAHEEEFLFVKRREYRREQDRYPQYFQPGSPPLRGSPVFVPKRTDTTARLVTGVRLAISDPSEPPWSIPSLLLPGVRAAVEATLAAREGRAMTLSLFADFRQGGREPAFAYHHMGRLMTMLYVEDYLAAGDGILPTGLGNVLIEELAPLSFPLFDRELLGAIWDRYGGKPASRRWWQLWAERRESTEHGRVTEAVDALLEWADGDGFGNLHGRRRRALARLTKFASELRLEPAQRRSDSSFQSEYARLVNRFDHVGEEAQRRLSESRGGGNIHVSGVGNVVQIGDNNVNEPLSVDASELMRKLVEEVRARATPLAAESGKPEEEILGAAREIETDLQRGRLSRAGHEALLFCAAAAAGVAGNAAYAHLVELLTALGGLPH